eukprot:scpid36527/ scgid3957/ Retrovirus-related Pol polyprotein LINE-1; Long interspersed element-1; Reverse transcriptase; Endonuclease
MLKSAMDIIGTWLANLFNAVRILCHCPTDLGCGVLVPIYKPGKQMGIPKSYRPITLLSVVRKVLTCILNRRTRTAADSYVRESQAGFRPGRSTADGVFYSRMLCERAMLGDWSYSAALLDFSGAFDTLVRSTALDRMTVAGAQTSTVSALISNTTARVKISSQLGEAFPTNIGVVQGDPLSPTMFNMYAEGAMRKIDAVSTLARTQDVPSPSTQYADDTTMHASSRSAVETIVATCEPIFKEDNLNLNVQKTVYLTASRTDASWKTVKLLGSLLDSTEDVAARIGAASRAFGSIAWKRHCLDSRLCMFSVLIVPVLLYNCGLWTLTKRQNEQLDVWQRRKLRYIFGVHYPHCISNQILYEKSKQQPISRVCKRRRLLWSMVRPCCSGRSGHGFLWRANHGHRHVKDQASTRTTEASVD